MIIHSSQARTIAGDKINEDLFRLHENCVWVLDGSSGLGEQHISSSVTDAAWFVAEIDKNLRALYDEVTPLPELLMQTVRQVVSHYEQLVPDKGLLPFEYPSCSIALVRFTDVVDYLILGDITLALKIGEEIQVITDPSVSRLDDQVVSAFNYYRQEKQASLAAAKERIRPLLQQNRALMNRKDGYWVLGLDVAAVNHALVGTFHPTEPAHLVLASDGFTRLIDLYQLLDNWSHLFQFIAANGLEQAITMLRDVEAHDPDCLQYPRLKCSDDATAIYLALIPN